MGFYLEKSMDSHMHEYHIFVSHGELNKLRKCDVISDVVGPLVVKGKKYYSGVINKQWALDAIKIRHKFLGLSIVELLVKMFTDQNNG